MAKDYYLNSQFNKDFQILRKYETSLAISKFLLSIMREPIIVIFLCVLIYSYNQILGVSISSVLIMAVFFQRILNNLTVIQQNYFAISVNVDFFRTMNSITETAFEKREITTEGQTLNNFNS